MAGTLGESSVAADLVAWYRANRRALPWRMDRDPYRVWLAEAMLQQTRVATVIPYYERFLARFPTLADLAASGEAEVLKLWENLGYYSRARNLRRAAIRVVQDFGGRLPDNRDDLLKLPGVGDYMAGAILSIAFDQPVAAVDGNVKRVLGRLFAMDTPVNERAGHELIAARAGELVPADSPGEFNQALMDLGSAICTPRKPDCPHCPLQNHCRAWKEGRQEVLPVRVKRPRPPHADTTAAVIRDRDGKLLLLRRPSCGLLCGLWKCPGAACRPDETPEDGLRRTVAEETGLAVEPVRLLGRIRHQYTHLRITLHVFGCKTIPDHPQPRTDVEWRWVEPGEAAGLALSKVDRQAAELAAVSG